MRRGYTDNREWPSFEHHRAAQHVRIGMEVRIPERIGDEGYPALRAPAVTVIRCIEAAAKMRLNSKHLESVAAGERAFDLPRLGVLGQRERIVVPSNDSAEG